MTSIRLLSLFALLSLIACQQEGPAEKAGRAMDDAARKAGRSIENAGEKVQDAARGK